MAGRPIRSRFLTATPVEDHGLLFPFPWIGHCYPHATATHTNSGYPASNTLDGNTGTEWMSGAAMSVGAIQMDLDFGCTSTAGMLISVLQNHSTDFATEIKVYHSDDDVTYTLNNTFSGLTSGTAELNVLGEHRYWRLEETDSSVYWWRIQEITVAEVAPSDARLNRLSAQVATQTDGDARLNRLSAQVATQQDGAARLNRLSVQVAIAVAGPIECVGASDGVAAVTGTLTNEGGLQSVVNGVASVVGALTIVTQLAGAPAGAATVEGSLTNTIQVEATSAGTSTASGTLSVSVDLAASPNGVATVSGALEQTHELTGTSDGVATVSGTLANFEPSNFLEGQSDGVAAVTGAIVQTNELAGDSDGVAGASGTLDNYLQGELEGSSAGSSTVTGILRGTAAITRTSIQVAVTPDGGDVRATRTSLQVAFKLNPYMRLAIGGATTVTGEIFVGELLYGQSDGTSTVYGNLSDERLLEGTSAGQATVTGATLFIVSPRIPGPIPYPFPHLSPFVHELLARSFGGSAVTLASLEQSQAGDSAAGGSASVSATLTNTPPPTPETPDTMTTNPAGVATVVGALDGSYLATELAGNSDGVATVNNDFISDAINQIRGLYMINSVGPGHSPTDDKSTIDGFVSQTFPDGTIDNTVRDLFLVQSVGISFNPTDDKSAQPGFVSQLFPDGEWDNVSRWLHLPQVVFELEPEDYRLTLGPTPRLPSSMVRGKPPVSQVRRGPEVV